MEQLIGKLYSIEDLIIFYLKNFYVKHILIEDAKI